MVMVLKLGIAIRRKAHEEQPVQITNEEEELGAAKKEVNESSLCHSAAEREGSQARQHQCLPSQDQLHTAEATSC